MPLFDYRCTECSTIYEVLHKGKELADDILCPSCGSLHHTKMISMPSIISKGGSSTPCDQGTCGMDRSCCGGSCN